MSGRRYRQVLAMAVCIAVAFCFGGAVEVAAQGLGGTGTVQGTV
jgi:hypothetical protein